MQEIETFLAMGEHGAFIWPAYALTAAVMIGFVVSSLRGLRAQRKALRALEAGRPARDRRRSEAAS